MKVRSEDILKPGAVLKVEKIDFNDPEVKKLFDDTKREQKRIKKLMRWTQKKQDALSRVITI